MAEGSVTQGGGVAGDNSPNANSGPRNYPVLLVGPSQVHLSTMKESQGDACKLRKEKIIFGAKGTTCS